MRFKRALFRAELAPPVKYKKSRIDRRGAYEPRLSGVRWTDGFFFCLLDELTDVSRYSYTDFELDFRLQDHTRGADLA